MKTLVLDNLDGNPPPGYDQILVAKGDCSRGGAVATVAEILSRSPAFLEYDFWTDLILFDGWATAIADQLEIDGRPPRIAERELFRFWLQSKLFSLHNTWVVLSGLLGEVNPPPSLVHYQGESDLLRLLLLNLCRRRGVPFQPLEPSVQPFPAPPSLEPSVPRPSVGSRASLRQTDIFLSLRCGGRPVVVLCLYWDVHLKILADAAMRMEEEGLSVLVVNMGGICDQSLIGAPVVSYCDFPSHVKGGPPIRNLLFKEVAIPAATGLPPEFSLCRGELESLLRRKAMADIKDAVGGLPILFRQACASAVVCCSEGLAATAAAYAAGLAGGVPAFMVPHGATPGFMRSYAFSEIAAWGRWMVDHFRQREAPPPSCTLAPTGAIRYDRLAGKRDWSTEALAAALDLPQGTSVVLFFSFWVAHPEEKAFKIKSLRQLAEALPAAAVLVVKKHPCYEDSLAEEILATLLPPSRFRVVDDSIDIYELIALSAAVVIAYSSSGYEAALLERPCVILDNRQYGKTAYAHYRIFRLARDTAELATHLQDFLRDGTAAIPDYATERRRFLDDCLGGGDGHASSRFAARVAARAVGARLRPPTVAVSLAADPPPLPLSAIRDAIESAGARPLFCPFPPGSGGNDCVTGFDLLVGDIPRALDDFSRTTMMPILLLRPPEPGRARLLCAPGAAMAYDADSLAAALAFLMGGAPPPESPPVQDAMEELLAAGLPFPAFLAAISFLCQRKAGDADGALPPPVLPRPGGGSAEFDRLASTILRQLPKESFIYRLLAPEALRRLALRGRRTALFPGGRHTRWLTSLVSGTVPADALVVFDDDAGRLQTLNGYPVRSPPPPGADDVGACILSTDNPTPALLRRATGLFGSKLCDLFGVPWDSAGKQWFEHPKSSRNWNVESLEEIVKERWRSLEKSCA